MIEVVKKFLGFFSYIYFCYLSKKNLIFLFHDITNSPCRYSLENNLFISKKNFLNIINHIDYHYKIIEPKSIINDNESEFHYDILSPLLSSCSIYHMEI